MPENVLGEERRLSWDEALAIRLDPDNRWYRKCLDYADVLVRSANGAFPVSHSPEIGPTDLHAVLRGHTQSILDLVDEPDKSADLLWGLGEIFRTVTAELWKRLPLFCGGYFDAQYSLWAPGPMIRIQEDATATYSPALYRRLVQPVDRMLAAQFPCSFIHLHSTSMHLLDAFLEINQIQCFQVNKDAAGPPLEKMVACFRSIQNAGKPLLVRGSFTAGELGLLLDSLEPSGLFLYVMAGNLKEVEQLRGVLGM